MSLGQSIGGYYYFPYLAGPSGPTVETAVESRASAETLKNGHRTHEGKALTFANNPALRDLYLDESPRKVIKKCVQVGISEYAIIESIAWCKNGHGVFYVMPKGGLRQLFIKRRMKPLIQMNPEYRQWCANAPNPSQSVEFFAIGNGAIRFASSETASDFDQFDADLAIVDDLQNCVTDHLSRVENRLSASVYKHRTDIGIPTYPNRGIDARFQDSDQKRWYLRCDACGTQQPLDFFTHIVTEVDKGIYEVLDTKADGEDRDIFPLCQKCHAPINRLDDGIWVKGQSHDTSGYAFSKTFSALTTIRSLVERLNSAKSNPSELENFYTSDLGEPFIPDADFQLTDEILDACVVDYYAAPPAFKTSNPITMGVDVGSVINVRISEWADGKRKAIHIGTCADFETLDRYIVQYHVSACVIDARPETRKASEFQGRHPEVVWVCDYNTQVDALRIDKQKGRVVADRTQSLDAMVASYREGISILPANASGIPDFYPQMKASQRVLETRSSGDTFVWIHSGADHYFHADNYDFLAFQVFRENSTFGSGVNLFSAGSATGW